MNETECNCNCCKVNRVIRSQNEQQIRSLNITLENCVELRNEAVKMRQSLERLRPKFDIVSTDPNSLTTDDMPHEGITIKDPLAY